MKTTASRIATIRTRVKIMSLPDNPDDPEYRISAQTYIDDTEFLLDIVDDLYRVLGVTK
jgi:hypothetical protein